MAHRRAPCTVHGPPTCPPCTVHGPGLSLTDPPEWALPATRQLENRHTWPVLAGPPERSDLLLSTPIILADHPQLAPESPTNLFDGTEIDEILTLRILTLTDDEKNEMRNADDHTRRLLERTESLSPEQLMKLHGVLRNPHGIGGAQ